MPSPRTDLIYGHLKSDGSYVWFRYDIADDGSYQFLFQTGTSLADQTLVTSLPYFQNVLNYPGATTTTGSVIDPALVPSSSPSFADGTAAAPSIYFTNDTDTGLYRPGTNQIGFTTGGVQRAQIDSNGLTTYGAGATLGGSLHVANGNANNPSLSFDSDQDTGFFRHQPNEIGVAMNGIQYATWTATALSLVGVLTVSGTGDSSVAGNFLVGTLTNSTNGAVQLVTHTTKAGGIGFGTDVSWFRAGAGKLQMYDSGTSATISLSHSTTTAAKGLDLYIDSSKDAYLWQRENRPLYVGTNATTALTIDTSQNATFAKNLSDQIGNVRAIPPNAQTSAYTLVIGDLGKHIAITTGGVTVPASVFAAGDVVSIYNNSGSNQTITQGASVTMYLAGTATTGNRTLAQRGVCTVLCVASNTFVISGGGLT